MFKVIVLQQIHYYMISTGIFLNIPRIIFENLQNYLAYLTFIEISLFTHINQRLLIS